MGRRKRAHVGGASASPLAGAHVKLPEVATASANTVVKISGYSAIQLPPAGSGARWIYMRQHAPGVLFIANLPTAVDVFAARRAVPAAGPDADDVVVQGMPGGRSRFARVRLRGGEADVKAALSEPFDWLALECFHETTPGAPSPPEQWLDAYWNARDLTAVQKWSAATMDTFERVERAKEEREKAEAEAAAAPDEDGFVVVRRGAAAVGAAGVTANAFSSAAVERRSAAKKKNKASTLQQGVAPDGFYRWQRRAGRKRELDELQKQFEGDKKRVAAIRNLAKLE